MKAFINSGKINSTQCNQSRTKGGATGASALGAIGKWGANTFLLTSFYVNFLIPLSNGNMEGGRCAVFAPAATMSETVIYWRSVR
jgi:hypothetical protein